VCIQRDAEPTAVHDDDECEPIPQEVIETINHGEEQPLRHNDGLGLWIVKWIADTVDGELSFSRREDTAGNRVTLRFQRLESTGL
jgi:two-component sensor histidine kinase